MALINFFPRFPSDSFSDVLFFSIYSLFVFLLIRSFPQFSSCWLPYGLMRVPPSHSSTLRKFFVYFIFPPSFLSTSYNFLVLKPFFICPSLLFLLHVFLFWIPSYVAFFFFRPILAQFCQRSVGKGPMYLPVHFRFRHSRHSPPPRNQPF